MPVPILIATLMRPAGDTGVQTHFRALGRFLDKLGTPCRLLTPFDSPNWQVYPVFALRKLIDPLNQTASVGWYRHWHATFLRHALAGALKLGTPAVIYAQCPLSANAALDARHNVRQKVVMVVHFNISQADEWAGKGAIKTDGIYFKAIRAFEARTLPKLDGIVYVSDFMRRELLARIPQLADVPYAVIPNFLRDPGFDQPDEPPHTDLITIGTLEARKNQAYALEIIAAAKRAGRPISLTLVGDGPDRARLEALAKELDVLQEVRFVGYVPNAATLMHQHRACLHVARIENMPLTLIEALAHALPVFSPAVGGIPEVFEEGESGRFIPLDAPEAAARDIVDWLDRPEQMARAGAQARARFLAHFEEAQVAARLREFLLAGTA